MSDIYLVLRNRLDAVTNWVAISTEVLKNSRKTRGLSYEAVGRLAKVSSKTYERYERDGRVPEHMVDTFAEILGLEIDRPVHSPTRVTVEGDVKDQMDALREEVAEVRGMVAELLERTA